MPWTTADSAAVAASVPVRDVARIGRALDALAEQAEAVAGPVGARAITAFGLDVTLSACRARRS
jgi:hypothetical protein